MSYLNPKHRQELQFIVWLMEHARWGIVPDEFIGRIRELYGEPNSDAVPPDLSDKIIDALQEVRFFHSRKHRESERHGYGPGYYFGSVRGIILREFYPGKEQYYRIQKYWKEQGRKT